MFMHVAPYNLNKVQCCVLSDIILVSWFYKILRCWTFCGYSDIWVLHHCRSILKASWRSM